MFSVCQTAVGATLTHTTKKVSENHVMPETLFKCRVSCRGSNIYMLVLTNTTRLLSRVQFSTADTSSTAQGGGGSFKNRKRIGEIDCCE